MDNHERFIGLSIDGFIIVKKLGNGAIGTVFFAENKEEYSKRAIKIIPKNKIEIRPNWEQEIKKPNLIESIGGVVQYYSHKEKEFFGEKYICIIWQYINGESLKSVIEGGKITLQILIDVIERSLDIFYACSKINIQHSDFHSGNILVEFPNELSMDNNKRNIWITDFGYGTFSDIKPPLEDYKGLATIIQHALERIDFHALLEKEDRIKFSALKHQFSKLLLEENPLEGDYVRNPPELKKKMYDLFVERESTADYQKSVGDYLATEFIGERLNEWELLFVPKFLAINELLDRNICVLTGLRGCGKTMIFKRLSTQLVSKLGKAGIEKEDSFICFYLNARSIAEAFPWLPDTEEIKARKQVINFFHLKWTVEILQWLRHEYEKNLNINGDVSWLIEFFKSYFDDLYLTSNTPKGTINNLLFRCDIEIAKSKLTDNYSKETLWPLSTIDYLEKLLGIISKYTSFANEKSYFMLLDDYSTPLVTEATQRILNSIVFRRCSEVFFKVSTESTESFVRLGLNEKHLEEGADFKFIELGAIAINCSNEERQETISAIFQKRIDRSELFVGQKLSLLQILGRTNLDNTKRAQLIREGETQTIYYGFTDFCNMWSSDLRELIKIFSEMISEQGEEKIRKAFDSSDKEQDYIIPKEIQDKTFRQAGGKFLHALSNTTNPSKNKHASVEPETDDGYGKHLYNIVTSFQEISYFALKNKESGNQGRRPPKQARKIELTTAIEQLNNESQPLYSGLIRYGVFIRDYRGKSVRGTAAVRLYLRSLLIPYCRLTFSKRDNISFDWDDFNEFLLAPQRFKEKYLMEHSEKKEQKAMSEEQVEQTTLY